MKNNYLSGLICFLLFFSCEFDKSVKKDLVTGLKGSGNGLSCDAIYLTSNDTKLNTSSFIYGEVFKVNFENISGFNKEENFAFPGMKFLITSEAGDTLMHNTDLYENNAKGFDLSPLLLLTEITTGAPLNSGGNYNLQVQIWDKKGEGTYSSELDFEVIPNPKIAIESDEISYEEIYLYSDLRKTVLPNNSAKYGEEIYLLLEGLDGFKDDNGLSYIGVRMKATDANNNIIINEADLIGDSPINSSDLQSQLAPNFIFQETDIKSPIACEVYVWDKRGEHTIEVNFSLTLE
ncbi:MAG: hypothetical protein KJO77_08945 [Bacteroidia bacterium]|nr:hypothetical protein [Bacteroidia bacterium]